MPNAGVIFTASRMLHQCRNNLWNNHTMPQDINQKGEEK